MGGAEDQSGHIDGQRLIDVIKGEFDMTIDIEKLLIEIDDDGSGEIEYDEFKQLMEG